MLKILDEFKKFGLPYSFGEQYPPFYLFSDENLTFKRERETANENSTVITLNLMII